MAGCEGHHRFQTAFNGKRQECPPVLSPAASFSPRTPLPLRPPPSLRLSLAPAASSAPRGSAGRCSAPEPRSPIAVALRPAALLLSFAALGLLGPERSAV